jgi:hypothetical protein
MGARGECGESKRDGEAVLEGTGRTAKGEEEETEIEEGMRSNFCFFLEKNKFCIFLFLGRGGETGNPSLFHLDGREASRRHVYFFCSGYFVPSTGFSKMIGDG